jgi:hypothetical protein
MYFRSEVLSPEADLKPHPYTRSLYRLCIGLGISDKKIIPRKTELTEQMVISDGIPTVPRNRNSRNSVPNPSAEEKTTRNSVPWSKNRSKVSGFRSESFRERANSRNSLPWKRERLGIPFRGAKTGANSRNSVPNHSAEEKTIWDKTRQHSN